ncbi:MAG TPA: hypothetical protein VGZ47_14330, partial [Gemmataceae bacterium]|nr:hypothetical protein [Gemmataceae bacterium]
GKPAQRAGAAAQFNRPTAPMSQGGGAQPEGSMADITYIPSIDAFFSQTMDVYSWGAGPPPIDANRRATGTNILITGTFPEGMRQKIQSADAYTHVIICDANIEIRDGYTGGGQQAAAGEDILTIPAGQKQNYWIVRFCFVTQLPGMGRKKILLVDRQAAGNWPTMV